MFGLLRRQKPYEQEAHRIYAAVLDHIRMPEFYTSGAVPDSFDGRFDLMVLHLFLVLEALRRSNEAQADILAQAIFDTAFSDMDQVLREQGAGDMSVPKHMRRMMKGFNGRVHAYSDALEQGPEALELVLARNLYGTIEDVSPDVLQAMAAYVRANIAALSGQSMEDIVNNFEFLPLWASEQDEKEIRNDNAAE